MPFAPAACLPARLGALAPALRGCRMYPKARTELTISGSTLSPREEPSPGLSSLIIESYWLPFRCQKTRTCTGSRHSCRSSKNQGRVRVGSCQGSLPYLFDSLFACGPDSYGCTRCTGSRMPCVARCPGASSARACAGTTETAAHPPPGAPDSRFNSRFEPGREYAAPAPMHRIHGTMALHEGFGLLRCRWHRERVRFRDRRDPDTLRTGAERGRYGGVR